MQNSADIRRDNKKRIYHFLLDGKAYTKQQVAAGTGLSVATCNTLLNELTAQGILLDDQRQPGAVGRTAVLYQINEKFEQYLAVHFTVSPAGRTIESLVFSPTGKILSKITEDCAYVDYEKVVSVIRHNLSSWPETKRIIIGTPSIAEHGIIRHCDIPELENVPMKARLEETFRLSVDMENDMHHKAYGYYKMTGSREDVITLGYFTPYVLPGTATIHKGTIIRGTNGIAGMTGFLPYDLSREEQQALLERENCAPIVAKALSAIMVLLNPGTIVLTGTLIDADILEKVKELCGRDIPKEYMPQFVLAESLDDYYYAGMYQLAVDHKTF